MGIAGRVQRTGQSINIGDVDANPDYIKMNPSTCSEMSVPLIDNGKVIGSLSVESEQNNAFMEQDVEALEMFAQLVTILRKNGRQFSELMDTRKQVESVTALSLMTMITGVWQHANKSRAVTIRDRVKLLQLDLEDGKPENIERHIKVIKDAAHKISSRKMRENLSDHTASKPERLSEFIANYINEKLEHQTNKGVTITKRLADDDHCRVRVQRDWFEEMLDILFNNASFVLKEVKDAQISFISAIDTTAEQYILTIKDNGPGFPREMLNDILMKPVQKKPNEDGNGIGLLMARLIVESFGGRIDVKNSVFEKGACITMTFPVDMVKPEQTVDTPIWLNNGGFEDGQGQHTIY
ncbi:MAG: ATP-binding protein [Chloroflexota bacterium]